MQIIRQIKKRVNLLKKYLSEESNVKELREAIVKNFDMIKYICNVTYASLYYGTNSKGQAVNFKVLCNVNEYCNEISGNFC